jgi:hypothetical protein
MRDKSDVDLVANNNKCVIWKRRCEFQGSNPNDRGDLSDWGGQALELPDLHSCGQHDSLIFKISRQVELLCSLLIISIRTLE